MASVASVTLTAAVTQVTDIIAASLGDSCGEHHRDNVMAISATLAVTVMKRCCARALLWG